MSAFDDLLNFDSSSDGRKDSSDPFDPFSGEPSSQKAEAGSGGGNLLDLGFDTQTSAENGGQINFDANTNPLYEFTNSRGKMATDSTNPLYDMESEPAQKDLKSENTNLLYDFMQNESAANGHAEDSLQNGGGDVDLLGGGEYSRNQEDLLGGDQDQEEAAREKQQDVDLLGGGEGQNEMDNSGDLLDTSSPVDGEGTLTVEEGNKESMDLLESSGPIATDDLDDNEPGETIQTRSRSSSEHSEPEQDQSGQVDMQPEPIQTEADTVLDQSKTDGSSLNDGPAVDNLNHADASDKKFEEVKKVDSALDDQTEGGEDNRPDIERAADETAEVVEDNMQGQVADESQPELEPEIHDQFDDAEHERDVVEDEADLIESKEAMTVESQPQTTQISETSKLEEVHNDAGDETEKNEQVSEMEHQEAVEDEAVAEEVPQEKVSEPVYDGMGDMNEVQAEPAGEAEVPESEPEPATMEPEDSQPDLGTEPEPAEIVPVDNQPYLSNEPAVEEAVSPQTDLDTQQKELEEVGIPVKADVQEQKENIDDVGDDARRSPVAADTAQTDAVKVNGTSEYSENGVTEEEAVRDPNIFRETREKEEVHFAEMSNVRQRFESGGGQEEQVRRSVSIKDEYAEGGEYENEPVQNPDVVKETDLSREELPEVGTAKNLVNRFKSIQEEKSHVVASGRKASPPRQSEKVEYESTPTEHLPRYEGKSESGEFESTPKGHEGVVRSGEVGEDYRPEQGYARNILGKFKEIESQSKVYKSHEKREITPDRTGKVEYVSEPRGQHIEYNDTKIEAGVFENVPKEEEDVVRSGERAQEILPEVGMAKSLLSKFKQMETESGFKPPPSPKRELTPDRSGKVEYVSEPRGYLEKYEPQVESGEFESQPQQRAEVVRSGDHAEEVLPEVGSAKKTMERFKEIQRQTSSPSSGRVKEFTPPRESSPGRSVAGVIENTPVARPDVVRSGEASPDDRPAQGTAKNIRNRYMEMASSGSQSSSPGRKPKEFTPPPEAGVYENTPKEHLHIEVRQSESGILESTPTKSSADISQEREATPESELPEQGFAKNMVSRWKQLESSSASAKSTSSASPRFKEFTPPRDSRGPMSPKSPAGATTNGVHPRDLPGQYQPQESSVIVENTPEEHKDVYREADTDWTEGMPAPNTTSLLLQKFKSIQEHAKEAEATPPVTHVTRKAQNIQHE